MYRTEIDKMSYLTNSTSASGGVGEINLASGGFGYKKIPGIIKCYICKWN